MKRFLVFIMLLITTFTFAQDAGAQINWYRDYEMEEFFEDWDVYVEVWMRETESGLININLEDVWSEDWFDVRNQFATALYALWDETIYQDISLDELGINLFIYSWFEYNDQKNPDARYENDDERWDVFLDPEWLYQYWNARRDRDRLTMTDRVIDSLVAQWEEVNRPTFQRGTQQYEDIITEQQQLEDEFLPNVPLKQR